MGLNFSSYCNCFKYFSYYWKTNTLFYLITHSLLRSEGERSFDCPVCHFTIQIPTKGADAFPLNSFACNILNILAVENPHNCTNCEDRELASARCLDCVENLCVSCVTAHERIRQTKKHRIVSFEELQNNTVDESIRCPSFCKIHEREVCALFSLLNF